MAILAFEKAPISAIFPLPIQGAGQPGLRAENRERGEREALEIGDGHLLTERHDNATLCHFSREDGGGRIRMDREWTRGDRAINATLRAGGQEPVGGESHRR
jgi:hypothetical protein